MPFFNVCMQVKFNQALADHSMSDRPRLIDGIVLTKFDTIDDKVGLFLPLPNMYMNIYLQNVIYRSVFLEVILFLFFISVGWCCNFHDLHHKSAHCVCRYRTNL